MKFIFAQYSQYEYIYWLWNDLEMLSYSAQRTKQWVDFIITVLHILFNKPYTELNINTEN